MSATLTPLLLELPDGQKFKGYEKASQARLPENSYAVVRMDGKNFSNYTKRFAKPYDEVFMEAMDATTRQLCATIPGVVLAYTQSDEISIVFSDLQSEKSQQWLGGKLSKILSLSAATCTALFIKQMGLSDDDSQIPVFDARCHTLSGPEEIQEYTRWRRFDAQKNSVTMAANVLHSHSFLEGISSKGRLELLEGSDYEKLPEGFYNGRVTYREQFVEQGFRVLGPAHKEAERIPMDVVRSRWVTEPATRDFMEGKFLELISLLFTHLMNTTKAEHGDDWEEYVSHYYAKECPMC
jgi:tRNA(His) guanylyltransferase